MDLLDMASEKDAKDFADDESVKASVKHTYMREWCEWEKAKGSTHPQNPRPRGDGKGKGKMAPGTIEIDGTILPATLPDGGIVDAWDVATVRRYRPNTESQS